MHINNKCLGHKCITFDNDYNQKNGVGSKDRLEPISLNDASRFSLMVPIETRHSCFLIVLVVDW